MNMGDRKKYIIDLIITKLNVINYKMLSIFNKNTTRFQKFCQNVLIVINKRCV